MNESNNTNADPITGEPGSHPVGTGVGASAGAIAGAVLGTAVAGPLGTIVGGIAEAYTAEQMVGRKVVIVANLAPRKLKGIESQGMVVAASVEGGKPVLNILPILRQ